jgi:cytochrome P450
MNGADILAALTSPEGIADPYPLYAQLHRLGAAVEVQGMVLVSSYTEINAVLRDETFRRPDAATFDRGLPGWRDNPGLVQSMEWIINLNAPDHTRVRSLMGKAFTHRRVAALEPAIARMAGQMIDALADRGADGSPVEFMQEFASLLPVTVICELIGIPEADREGFRPLASDLAPLLDVSDLVGLPRANAAAVKMADYFTNLAAERRQNPRDDLISRLVQISDSDDGRLSAAELLSNLTLFFLAGFGTTTNLLGNGLYIIMQDPQLGRSIVDGSVPVGAFVEEVLRYDSPIQFSSRVGRAGEIGGVEVKDGAELVMVIGAGNRDPRRFKAPDTFDPGRADPGPLSFGAGAHFCMGAALARLEGAVSFPRLLQRFPALTFAAKPRRTHGYVLRGFETLPITLI